MRGERNILTFWWESTFLRNMNKLFCREFSRFVEIRSMSCGVVKWDRESATLGRYWQKYHLKNIHRCIWHRWYKSCNCHFLRLEVYLSNQEYSNLAAACFEPISFDIFSYFSLKDTLNKAITAISQNLWKQHIFFSECTFIILLGMWIKGDSVKCLERYQISSGGSIDNEPNPGDGFRCKKSTEEKPWFQIESLFCRELGLPPFAMRKSPAIGVHQCFFEMGINH